MENEPLSCPICDTPNFFGKCYGCGFKILNSKSTEGDDDTEVNSHNQHKEVNMYGKYVKLTYGDQEITVWVFGTPDMTWLEWVRRAKELVVNNFN